MSSPSSTALRLDRLDKLPRLPTRLANLLPEGLSSRLLAAAIFLGVIVGLLVAVLDYIVLDVVLERVLELPVALQVAAPLVGLVLTRVILLTWGQGCSPSTSEEYIYEFHSSNPEMATVPLRARLLGGITTIGFGGALGMEGPSIYLGSAIALRVQRALERYLSWETTKLLLTAGAAAGVSAVFQAPATGLFFALESPYRDDVVHRALLPSLVASAAAYLTFVSVPFVEHGSVLDFTYQPDLSAGVLGGAVAIGVGAGIGGRLFAWAIRRAKMMSKMMSPWLLAIGGGLILGALALASDLLFDAPLTLGPGVAILDYLSQSPPLSLVIALFVFRAVATICSVAAGGVGGLFIPLAMQGVIMGTVVGHALSALGWGSDGAIWPMLGLAAFLAAGYRTPLAAVVFVAESSVGAAVVPALIAAAVSQLVAGSASVSLAQKVERLGYLEQRFVLPLTSALTTDVLTVPPDATVSEFVWMHAIGRRKSAVPVVDGAKYLGYCNVDSVSNVARDNWEDKTVDSIMDDKLPTALPSWSLRDAVVAMRSADVDQLAVTDDSGTFIGVVYESEIVKLGEILEQTDRPGDH